jgi:pyrimidine-specific ribonucleoside hydrolase
VIPTTLHIDTDLGTDDALALLVASRLQGVTIAAISTVFGNVPVETATYNVQLLSALANQHWPLYNGASHATDGSRGNAQSVHGEDGLGGAGSYLRPSFDAASHPRPLSQLSFASIPAAAAAEKIVLLCIGPTTNIPALVAAYGSRIARIVILGGVFFDIGNITPHAEFNAWCDPDALTIALALDRPTLLVPLDLCRKIQLSRATIDSWPAARLASDPLLDLIVRAHRHYLQSYQSAEGLDGCFPHDLLALLVACWPERFYRIPCHVEVESQGPRRGATRMMTMANSQIELVTGGNLKWIRDGLRKLDFA